MLIFSKLTFIRVMECLLAYVACLVLTGSQYGFIPNSRSSRVDAAGGRQVTGLYYI